ncbi:MAG: TIGR03915 family putative DNA repair protein [Paludibacteraceae bacterium]|nr:TIGR03915 family putative DNA repair protein [Paludibacteraceae bacterium]
MIAYKYDKSFEGLLSAVFEAYASKKFPDVLLGENDLPPLFCDEMVEIVTDEERSTRVWKGLERRISKSALYTLPDCWLSELPDVDMLIFRYIRKAIDASQSIEMNFGDPDVMQLAKIWRSVIKERERVMQFVRFQKTADGLFFSCIEPAFNVLPITLSHFIDRFHDQKWIIYDAKRDYGFYYDLTTATEVHFDDKQWDDRGFLSESVADMDEKLFQQLWKGYFDSMAIKERLNPRLHKRNLPVRFWKYLPEKR